MENPNSTESVAVTNPTRTRLHSLDGLRGLAAVLVLVHHTLLLFPALIEPYRDPPAESAGTLVWWLAYTPLHAFWDGAGAVIVFFVLSGLVLALPLANGKAIHWSAYYPSRLVRLYFPVWGAVAFAATLIAVMPHGGEQNVSSWVSGHPSALEARGITDDLLLLASPGFTNSALWSLRWEVLFSLLLPVYVALAGRWKQGLAVKIIGVTVLLFVGGAIGPVDRTYQMGAIFHLSTFAVGVLLAYHWRGVSAWVTNLSRSAVAGAWIASAFAFSGYWLVYLAGEFDGQHSVAVIARVGQVAAASLIIVLSTRPGGWTRFLSGRPFQWLGTRSFSLYLVHEPIVVMAGKTAGLTSSSPGWLTIPAVLVALLAAELFFRIVEKPSHALARAVNARLRQR